VRNRSQFVNAISGTDQIRRGVEARAKIKVKLLYIFHNIKN
jgi:hypothetical protein